MNKKSLVAFLFCMISLISHAQVVRYVSPAGTMSWQQASSATSWETACPDLQAVINASSAGDEIWVSTGTYYPTHSANNWTADAPTGPNANPDDRDNAFVLKEGVRIYGGFQQGDTALSDSHWKKYPTILDGNLGNKENDDDNAYHVVIAAGLTRTTVLDGFIITGGNANGLSQISVNKINTVSQKTGAGIACFNDTLLFLQNLDVKTNKTILKIADDNGGLGGGLYSNQAYIECTNVIFRGNMSGQGGALNIFNNSLARLTNVLVCGNEAYQGGAMSITMASAIWTNVTITGNKAENQVFGPVAALGGQIASYNSIYWGNQGAATFATAVKYGGNNLFEGVAYTDNGFLDGTLAENNPRFVNAISYEMSPTIDGNYRLQKESPAIDAGNSDMNEIPVDLGGRLRILDLSIDMGAYEYADSTDTDTNHIFHPTPALNPPKPNRISQLATSLSLTIYPNPAHSEIQVTTTSKIKKIELYDLLGKLQKSWSAGAGYETTLDVSMFATGMYLLRVQMSKGTETRKILIQ
ncbi:MAG: T9SS type A sorting domain-containing protein [Bacteroidales bacterium]|jgi:hypothetical protein|nr:T9SS type A sorting domain-containing protein [Bacteroidales bacterium]